MTSALSLLSLLTAPSGTGTATVADTATDAGFVALLSAPAAGSDQTGGKSGAEAGASDPRLRLINVLGRLRSRAAMLPDARPGGPAPGQTADANSEPETGDQTAADADAARLLTEGLRTAAGPEVLQALAALMGVAQPAAAGPDGVLTADAGPEVGPEAIKRLQILLGMAPEGPADSVDGAQLVAALPPAVQTFLAGLSNAQTQQAGPDAVLAEEPGPDLLQALAAMLRGASLSNTEHADLAGPRGEDAAPAAEDATDPQPDPAEILETVAGLASVLAAALAQFERDTGSGLLTVLKSGAQAVTRNAAAGATGPDVAEAGGPAAAVQMFLSVVDRVERGLNSLAVTPVGKPANRNAPAQTSQPGGGMVPNAGAQSVAMVAPDPAQPPGPGITVGTGSLSQAVIAGRADPEAATAATTTPVVAMAAPDPAGGPRISITAAADGAPRHDADPQADSLLRQITAAAAIAPAAAEGTRRAADPALTPEDILRALSAGDIIARHAGPPTAARTAEPAAETPRFAAALTAQIRAAEVSEGHTRIELSPRGLGTVEVDVRTEADGSLKVVVRADNPAVLNSLRQERDLLAQAIGGTGGGNLDFQTFSHGSDSGARDQRSAPALAPADADFDSTAPTETATAATTIGAGRLDIMT